MPNSFDIIVYYQNQEQCFHIGANLNSLEDLKNSVGNYFHIDIKDFIIEVYNDHYDLCITLDKHHFEDLRSDSSPIEDEPLTARLRSRNQTTFNEIYDDDDKLSVERHGEWDGSLSDHVVVWLDPHIGLRRNCRTLKDHLETMIEPFKAQPASGIIDDDIALNTLLAVDKEDYSVSQNYIRNKLFVFSDIPRCLTFLNRASADEKSIFLIIDDCSIRTTLPQVFDNMRIYRIYILANQFRSRDDLIKDVIYYYKRILIFDHDEDLFSRLLRDIGEYYSRKASTNHRNPRLRLLFLTLARDFYGKGDKNDKLSVPSSDVRSTEGQISELEKLCETNFEEEKHDAEAF